VHDYMCPLFCSLRFCFVKGIILDDLLSYVWIVVLAPCFMLVIILAFTGLEYCVLPGNSKCLVPAGHHSPSIINWRLASQGAHRPLEFRSLSTKEENIATESEVLNSEALSRQNHTFLRALEETEQRQLFLFDHRWSATCIDRSRG
jgi:hypothetical protein